MPVRPVISVVGLCGQSVFLNVDHFHAPGETIHADGIHSEPGGKGYNQAVSAARLGADVHFFSCCGDDSDMNICRQFLLDEGITPHFQMDKTHNTAYATILTDKDGENRVTVYRGAADFLSGDYIKEHEDIIARSDIVILNFEYPMDVNFAVLDIAERYGVKVILNPAPAEQCSREFLDRFYCITPNESEAQVIGFETCREVITLGSKGACVIENGERTYLDAIKVKAKDTTGAGDCFTAALAVKIAEGRSLIEAAGYAMKAAALSVTKQYVMPALPGRDEII